MLCPFDATDLKVVNRQGIDIDWCPTCKGVWLERGELDKLIDQAGSLMPSQPAPVAVPSQILPASQPHARRDRDDDDDDDWDDRRRAGTDGYRGKKRKNLLSEIFDF